MNLPIEVRLHCAGEKMGLLNSRCGVQQGSVLECEVPAQHRAEILESPMLILIALGLLVAWVAAMATNTMPQYVHLLLVLAGVMVVVRFIMNRTHESKD